MKKILFVLVCSFLVCLIGSPTQTVFAAAPAKPSLSSPGNGSSWAQSTVIELKWNATSGATQYKVELWGGPYTTMVPCNWVSGTSCWIGTMWPGTMYWHVKARNASGEESAWSDTWSFVIQGNGTPPPSVTPPPGGGICTKPGDVIGFELARFYKRLPASAEYVFLKIASEFYADGSGSKCEALVSIAGNPPTISIQNPHGEIVFNDKFEPVGGSFGITRQSPQFDWDLASNAGGSSPETGLYLGEKFKSNISGAPVLTLEATTSGGNVYIPRLPRFNFNYAVSPQVAKQIAILGAIGVIIVTIPAKLVPQLNPVIGPWYFQQTGGQLGTSIQLLNTSPRPSLMAFEQQPNSEQWLSPLSYPVDQVNRAGISMNVPTNDVIQAMRESYGPLVDSATLGTLTTSRTRISAYTQFTYAGNGFSPNSAVYMTLGLPGRQGLFSDVIKADGSGRIGGSFEMPTPNSLELGNYVLIALDHASLNNSISQIMAGQRTAVSVYMAGTNIEVVRDVTPPTTITTLNGQPGNNGWYISPVTVSLSATDDLSGVAKTLYQVDSGAFLEGTSVTLNDGTHTVKYYSVDKVGNVETTKSMVIKVDTVPPVVNVSTDKPQYTRVEPFIVHYTCTDPQPGSGIASCTATFNNQAVQNSQSVDLFWLNLGSYSVNARGEDVAGWVTTKSASFQLVATIESLKGTVDRLCKENFIDNKGICNSLQQKLDAALATRNRGQTNAAANELQALQKEVNAQIGKAIKPEAARILIMDSDYMIKALGGK